MTSPHSVLIVDDQAPFRLAVKAVLRRLPGFELAGEASSGAEAIALVDELHPALVLMDINMADRLGAIGGTVRWDSRPGHGATISGSVPLAAQA